MPPVYFAQLRTSVYQVDHLHFKELPDIRFRSGNESNLSKCGLCILVLYKFSRSHDSHRRHPCFQPSPFGLPAMDLDKFRSLSLERQEEILKECAKIMKKTDGLFVDSETPPSSPGKIKRELRSPETPCHGQSKKVSMFQICLPTSRL